MRAAAIIAGLLPLGLLAACADGPSLDLVSGPFAQSTVAYATTTEEQTLDCKQLAYVLDTSINKINALPATAELQRKAPPGSVVMVFSRIAGGGIAAVQDYDIERARAQALSRLLELKRCPAVDVDARTKDAAEKIAGYRKS